MISLLSSVPGWSRTPVLIGLAGLVLWASAERWLNAARLQQAPGASRDRGSFWLLLFFWYGVVIFSLLDAVSLRWSTVAAGLSLLQFLGVPFLVLGLVARVLARLTLGKAFSPVVQATASHELVTTGDL